MMVVSLYMLLVEQPAGASRDGGKRSLEAPATEPGSLDDQRGMVKALGMLLKLVQSLPQQEAVGAAPAVGAALVLAGLLPLVGLGVFQHVVLTDEALTANLEKTPRGKEFNDEPTKQAMFSA
jgi:hypothetical protein